MGRLLIDERPLTVLPSLVKTVGMERAVILQQIHWLLQSPNNGFEHDGARWVWGSYEEWCADYFPFWEADTLRKHIVKLEKDGYVISAQIRGFDRRKAYRIDRTKVDAIESAMRHDDATSKRKKFHHPNRHDHAASMRDDHATSKRDDDAASNRDDHAALMRDDHAGSYIKTSTETSTKTSTEDDEKATGVAGLWARHFEKPMPEKMVGRMEGLVAECGLEAVAHGLTQAAAEGARNFAYIAQCARNYIPPATNGLTKSYQVDLAPPPPVRVVSANAPAPALSLDTSDPWRVCLPELARNLHPNYAARLVGSRLEPAGHVNDALGRAVPLYRVVVTDPEAIRAAPTLNLQLGGAIRRAIKSVIGDVQIEIVAAETEPTHA